MDTNLNSQRPKGRDGNLSSLNVAIEAMNLAKEVSSVTPAKAVFGSVSVLLTMIRDSMVNKLDYVELGLACADVCRALDRGVNGRRLDELSQSVSEAIEQLAMTVAGIQEKIVEKGGRNLISRIAHAKNDKDTIAAWKLDLITILQVFNTELTINTNVIVSDIHRNILAGQWSAQPSVLPGELPPPPPRVCFGRGELIETIIGLAENLTPIALIGAGGIGKTSIALTVLHDDRIKKRFGENRRFIRCDQFLPSRAHLLSRLSKVVGAGVENPEDLIPLRPFLSSKEMLIILDNAESVLDPQGTNAQEIYAAVEELSQLNNICLCITTRISAIPPDCETLSVPTLPMDAAHDAFYRIYKNDERPDLTNDILEQLDFHPLSITLLATVAHHNMWDADQLAREWDQRRTGVLQTEHNKSLAATIELSLSSPMFQELGPDARDLLGVIAFFPRGINRNNLDWLFPTISNRANILDKFCILSLTYRSNGFVTMLAPLRGYLCPKDPKSSPLLCTTKDHYSRRLSVDITPGRPGFEEARWITSEDVNVEHLLDTFTAIDATSADVWDICRYFMRHLRWHKRRLVVLGPRIEGLPDAHPSKPHCLLELSQLFDSVGDQPECKRLLTQALNNFRERGDRFWVAQTLVFLCDSSRLLGLHREGMAQAKEALGIYEQLNIVAGQALSLQMLAGSLYGDGQLAAAEEAASRAIDISLGEGEQAVVCRCHRVLGEICQSKGDTEKAINHFEAALAVASSFDWHNEQFWNHHSLAELFLAKRRFDDAHAHIERAKSHTVNDAYSLGRAMEFQARIWYRQRRLEEARSEVLRATDAYEKLGARNDVEECRKLLRRIEAKMNRILRGN